MPVQDVLSYRTHKHFKKDQKKRLRNGWRIVSVTEETRSSGPLRWMTIGLLAPFVKPAPRVTVVYEHD